MVSGGLDGAGAFSGGGFVNGALRGITGNVIAQGIDMAAGLQQKFDWAGVATAGVTSGVAGSLSGTNLGLGDLNKYGVGLIAGTAGALVGAGARTLITGTDFGDNILAQLPNVIGSTIGSAIAGEIEQHQANVVQSKIDAALAAPVSDAESQAAADAIAADPNSLQWGGKTLSTADAEQIIVDRMRMDQLAQSGLGDTQAFQDRYAAFQDGLAAYDSYNTTSNQTILGSYLTRVTSGAYVQGLVTNDADSGFQGYLYHDSIGNRNIFADAGTTDIQDMATDYALGGNQPVKQVAIARANAVQLFINQVPNLTFTGHSLGGALAIVQGLAIGDPVVTFNSAPFTATMAGMYGVSLTDANRLVTNYRVANDPLSLAENNHEMVTKAAVALALGGVLPLSAADNAWRLAPPPGTIITLPAGAPAITAHSMLNVLNLLSD